MNKPQKPESKVITPKQALEAIGKAMTAVDLPVKQFKRREYQVLENHINNNERKGDSV